MPQIRNLQKVLRKVGIEVGSARWAVPRRRVQILNHNKIDLVLDVGANFGQYGDELRDCGWHGRILSFEPGSEAFRRLEGRVATDPAWDARRVALGDTPGELTLNISEESRFSSPLPVRDETVRRTSAFRYATSETVPVERLDDILMTVTTDCFAVKVDVQGFERQGLDGATETLKRADVFEMEMTAHPVYEGQMLVVESMERMADAGLVLSLVENIYVDVTSGRSLQFNGIFVRE
jgi:FkbM family methyltransferase